MSTSTDYQQAFATATAHLNGHNTSWMDQLRQAGFDRFLDLGIPSRRNEEWKYTTTRPIQSGTFSLREDGPCDIPATLSDVRPENAIELVFIDGLFQAGLTSGPVQEAGITITPFSDALERRSDGLQQSLSYYDATASDAFTGLNTALLGQGVVIDIAADTAFEPLIHVLHIATHESAGALFAPRLIVNLAHHAQAAVLESWTATDDTTSFTNTVTDLFAAEGAHLAYCKIQDESRSAYHVGTTRVHQAANSNVQAFTLNLGAQLARHNLDIIVDGEGCDSTLDGLYILQGNQHVDNHTTVDHRFPHCESSQLYKGLLDGKSRGVFNGKIFVRQAAQKTNAYQLNQNLLLSPGTRIDTKPQLEIYADDVRCTHGATLGQLAEDEIFYLQSRCINREDAIKLLARGYCQEVVYRVKHDGLRNLLHQYVRAHFCLKRLGQ